MRNYSTVNREVTEMLPLSSKKISKFKYLTGEEILPSDQSVMLEQDKLTNSPYK